MCEIFAVRGNKKGIEFELSALRAARLINSDGAGYVIFQKDNLNKFEVVTMEALEPMPLPTYNRSYYSTPNYQVSQFDDDYPGQGVIGFESELDMTSPVAKAHMRNKRKQGKKAKQGKHIQAVSTYIPAKHDSVPEKIYELQSTLKNNQLMVAHFRFATSGGVTTENTHPIVNGDYMVIHNGVFGYTKLPEGFSDTRYFTEVLKNVAKKLNIKKPRAEQKLIQQLLNEAGGYYSIFIYSWRTKTLYYYKSTSASFSHDQSGLLGATREIRFPVVTLEPRNGIVR